MDEGLLPKEDVGTDYIQLLSQFLHHEIKTTQRRQVKQSKRTKCKITTSQVCY